MDNIGRGEMGEDPDNTSICSASGTAFLETEVASIFRTIASMGSTCRGDSLVDHRSTSTYRTARLHTGVGTLGRRCKVLTTLDECSQSEQPCQAPQSPQRSLLLDVGE